jgi:hypothetical protein
MSRRNALTTTVESDETLLNAATYPAAAQAYLQARGGGFVLALAAGKKGGVSFEASPEQFGAWLRYFEKIKYFGMASFMRIHHSRIDACFTVPAEWPHQFDMRQATVQDDHYNGQVFKKGYRPVRVEMADAAQRLATVAAWRSKLPRDPRKPQAPPEPEKPFLSGDDIKTPAAPLSDEMKVFLASQGLYPRAST